MLKRDRPFVWNVAKLVGWTVLAQALYLAFLPVLTRIYSKADFGNLKLLQVVGACLIIVSGLRYELAVLLPEKDEDAVNVAAVALFTICCTSFVVVGFCLFGPTALLFRGDAAFLREVWWLLPLYQLGAGGTELITNWASRKRAFDAIARTKIAQIGSQLVVQLGLGFTKAGGIGLYFGDVLGRVGGMTNLTRLMWRQDRELVGAVSWRAMGRVAKQYRAFPLVASWAALMGVASRQLPAAVVFAYFGPAAAGAYYLASQALAAPLELVCRAYTQVYYGEAAAMSREEPEALRRLFLLSGRRLLFFGMVPALQFGLVAPSLFPPVFGAKWYDAGIYARCLAIMLPAYFVSFPLIHTLNILERQSLQIAWDFATLVLAVGGMIVLALRGASPITAVLYYSCAMAAMYAVHYVMSYVAIGHRIRAHRAEARAT